MASRWDRVRHAGPRVPTSVSLAVALLALDRIIVVAALGQIAGFGDMSTAGMQVFGSW